MKNLIITMYNIDNNCDLQVCILCCAARANKFQNDFLSLTQILKRSNDSCVTLKVQYSPAENSESQSTSYKSNNCLNCLGLKISN